MAMLLGEKFKSFTRWWHISYRGGTLSPLPASCRTNVNGFVLAVLALGCTVLWTRSWCPRPVVRKQSCSHQSPFFCWSRSACSERTGFFCCQADSRLQTLLYGDTFPPTTVIIGYAIGFLPPTTAIIGYATGFQKLTVS